MTILSFSNSIKLKVKPPVMFWGNITVSLSKMPYSLALMFFV